MARLTSRVVEVVTPEATVAPSAATVAVHALPMHIFTFDFTIVPEGVPARSDDVAVKVADDVACKVTVNCGVVAVSPGNADPNGSDVGTPEMETALPTVRVIVPDPEDAADTGATATARTTRAAAKAALIDPAAERRGFIASCSSRSE